MSLFKTAPVNMFTSLRNNLLVGPRLAETKAMQASISKYGLLSPLVVSKINGRLLVIDGRKRFAAIRKLSFMGQLPRSLVKIPYILVEDLRQYTRETPALLSNRDLYTTVINLFRETQDVAGIASELFIESATVRKILSLSRLSARLRRAYFDEIITYEAAKAYAALRHHSLQEAAFLELGPFASEERILAYGTAPRFATPLAAAA